MHTKRFRLTSGFAFEANNSYGLFNRNQPVSIHHYRNLNRLSYVEIEPLLKNLIKRCTIVWTERYAKSFHLLLTSNIYFSILITQVNANANWCNQNTGFQNSSNLEKLLVNLPPGFHHNANRNN